MSYLKWMKLCTATATSIGCTLLHWKQETMWKSNVSQIKHSNFLRRPTVIDDVPSSTCNFNLVSISFPWTANHSLSHPSNRTTDWLSFESSRWWLREKTVSAGNEFIVTAEEVTRWWAGGHSKVQVNGKRWLNFNEWLTVKLGSDVLLGLIGSKVPIECVQHVLIY